MMVLLLHTSVTCNNLISECDFRQSSSGTQEGNKTCVSRAVRPFLKFLNWAFGAAPAKEGAALHLMSGDGCCSPQRNSHLSHVCTARNKLGIK